MTGIKGTAEALASGLATWGNPQLLEEPSVGICGSRKASASALDQARLLAQSATDAGLIVVSGYAGGVDQSAHLGALDSGGQTIAVLAEGLAHFSLRVALREVATPSNFLAVSQFDDACKWTAWRAMERNKTIIDLSRAMFVVEAGDTGGTLDAGLETIRRGKPLFVLDYKNVRETTKGNKILLERGGHRITNRREMREALNLVLDGSLVPSGRLF